MSKTVGKKFFSFNSEARKGGFNLPAVIMAVAILCIAAIGISKVLVFSKRTQKDSVVRQSANKFQDTLRNVLAKRVRNFVLDQCTGNKYKPAGGSTTLSPLNLAFQQLTLNNGQEGGAASIAYTGSPNAKSSAHTAAANRCKSPRNKGAIGSGHYSYFCMNVAADTDYKAKKSTGRDSFWALDNGFMEVMLFPVDLATDQPIRCDSVSTTGVHGVKILYTIYYANKSGEKDANRNDKYLGKQINGVFYVSLE